MTDKEAMQIALTALLPHKSTITRAYTTVDAAIDALRTALAQPDEQFGITYEEVNPQPVAWADKYDAEREGHDFWVSRQKPARDGVPLYTDIISDGGYDPRNVADAAAKKEWVKLTDEEIDKYSPTDIVKHRVAFARVIEAKLKEKNGY